MLSFCDQLSSSVLALLKAKHPTKYTAIKAIRVTINIALALLQGCQQTNFTRVTVSGGSTMRPAGAYARAQLGIFFGYKPNIFLLVLKNK